jgi:hypothetical protein
VERHLSAVVDDDTIAPSGDGEVAQPDVLGPLDSDRVLAAAVDGGRSKPLEDDAVGRDGHGTGAGALHLHDRVRRHGRDDPLQDVATRAFDDDAAVGVGGDGRADDE